MPISLLVCAATPTELRTFLRDDENWPGDEELYRLAGNSVALAVTGAGIPSTLLRLPPLLAALEPALVLNIGIAGAYPGSGLGVGAVAMARSEMFGDIGFELPHEPDFTHVSAAPFGGLYRRITISTPPAFRFQSAGYPSVETDGCTVNSCTGTERTGRMRERLFGVGIESMEGAAVALACGEAGAPVCEIRAISNIAADRDMRPENVDTALKNLRHYLQECRCREGI